jgi:hypothetical protein
VIYGRRFGFLYATLALALVGAGAFAWHAATATHRPARVACNGPRGSQDPIVTAITFIQGAVERDHPENAYRLVLASARPGVSCERWARGQIPFPRYRKVDWNRSSYRRIAGGTGQIVLGVTLFSLVEHPSKAKFVLELQQDGQLWQVGYFAPA